MAALQKKSYGEKKMNTENDGNFAGGKCLGAKKI